MASKNEGIVKIEQIIIIIGTIVNSGINAINYIQNRVFNIIKPLSWKDFSAQTFFKFVSTYFDIDSISMLVSHKILDSRPLFLPNNDLQNQRRLFDLLSTLLEKEINFDIIRNVIFIDLENVGTNSFASILMSFPGETTIVIVVSSRIKPVIPESWYYERSRTTSKEASDTAINLRAQWLHTKCNISTRFHILSQDRGFQELCSSLGDRKLFLSKDINTDS